MAEYSLRDFQKSIGITEYRLMESLPDDLKSTLPTIEEMEERLRLDDESNDNSKDSEQTQK